MKFIGVMGCTPRLPDAFPLEMAENSGNMIHANAPFEMFDNCIYIKDDAKRYGYPNFSTLVNESCSHLIVTLANTLRLGAEDGSKYVRMQRFLESIRRPIVIFGLGVQSRSYSLDSASLPVEAIEFLKFLGERCAVIGVRGPYTKAVIERLCGIRNIMVVGCPSLFSRPSALAQLRSNKKRGRPAFSGTAFGDVRELSMFASAVKSDAFLIEPVNRFNHSYHLHVSRGGAPDEEIPYFLRKLMIKRDDLCTSSELGSYFRANYRLFRAPDEWYRFNRELVSFTFGTRFHVNMASILSGKPALWVTHDARTRELVEYLNLPSLPLDKAANLTMSDIQGALNLDEFFEHIGQHFKNFNEYLKMNDLPTVVSGF